MLHDVSAFRALIYIYRICICVFEGDRLIDRFGVAIDWRNQIIFMGKVCLANYARGKVEVTWFRINAPGHWNVFRTTGGRLNKKDGLTRYGDSHVKDKTS